MLDDGIHGVGNTEPVRPVVVGHAAVVLLDGEREADQAVLIEAGEAEEVDEHVDGVSHLRHVLQVHGAEVVAAGKRVREVRDWGWVGWLVRLGWVD